MTELTEFLNDLFSNTIGLEPVLSSMIVVAITIVFWIFIAVLINRISKRVIYKVMRVKKKGARALTIAKLLRSVVRYLVWFIVAMLVLSSLKIDLTPFIASAGVVGFALGFGAQSIVKDFMSGFFIIFDGQFEVGEIVEIGGFKGTVLTISLRTTIIENWKGERKIVNNGDIGSLINFSRNNSIAIVEFGVAYDTDLLRLAEIMPPFLEEVKSKYENITEMPSFLGVTELASSSINMRIIAKTVAMKHFQVERDIRRDLVVYFAENDITIPFPQVVVHNAKN